MTPAPQPGALQKVLNKILGKKVEIVALPPSVQKIVGKLENMMQARSQAAPRHTSRRLLR